MRRAATVACLVLAWTIAVAFTFVSAMAITTFVSGQPTIRYFCGYLLIAGALGALAAGMFYCARYFSRPRCVAEEPGGARTGLLCYRCGRQMDVPGDGLCMDCSFEMFREGFERDRE